MYGLEKAIYKTVKNRTKKLKTVQDSGKPTQVMIYWRLDRLGWVKRIGLVWLVV